MAWSAEPPVISRARKGSKPGAADRSPRVCFAGPELGYEAADT